MAVDTRILLRLMLRGALRTAGLIIGVYGVYEIVAGDFGGGRTLLAIAVILAVLSHPLVFRVLASLSGKIRRQRKRSRK